MDILKKQVNHLKKNQENVTKVLKDLIKRVTAVETNIKNESENKRENNLDDIKKLVDENAEAFRSIDEQIDELKVAERNYLKKCFYYDRGFCRS